MSPAEAVPSPEAMSATSTLTWAVVLMILAAGLAIVEFMVVSWGMLLVGAMVSAIAAIALAFHVSPLAGWLFVAATPAVIVFVLRTGYGLMRRNTAAVMSTELTADAGYRHAAESAGVAVGAVGELVTNAFPTGRARFAGHGSPVELDVQVQGRVLGRGDRVVVLAINGPVITVAAAPDTVSGLMTNHQETR